mgnify:CR=1 FL=1
MVTGQKAEMEDQAEGQTSSRVKEIYPQLVVGPVTDIGSYTGLAVRDIGLI